MSIRSMCATVGIAALLGVGAAASEPAPDTYVQNMKDTNKTVVTLRASVGAKDWAAAAKDAASLQVLFKATESFWKKRKTEDALKLSQTALKSAVDLEKAAKAKNEEGVLAAQRELTNACNTCHTAHRERTPDGKYAIK